MTKESGENAYRTYCKDRLVVSESVEKVDTEDTVVEKEAPKVSKLRKTLTLFIK